MKYIYTNNSTILATVLLATKNQEYVTTLVLAPGATKELDYPGLNMYVPSPLSCYTIDVAPAVVPEAKVLALESIVVVPVVEEPPVVVVPVVEELPPVEVPVVEEVPPVEAPVIEEIPPVVEPDFNLVPPPAPSIEVVTSATKTAKPKPGKKN